MSRKEIEEWINLPPWIKLSGRDEIYNTLAHSVCKKGFIDLIPHFLTEENSKFQNKYYSTPLHRHSGPKNLKNVQTKKLVKSNIAISLIIFLNIFHEN